MKKYFIPEDKMGVDPKKISIRYFDIAWLSRYDGPGHRVVLFLQGCPLRCPWCHSPHSQETECRLLYFPAQCQYCGRCEQTCRRSVHKVSARKHILHRKRCLRCADCIKVCPVSHRNRTNGALVLPTKKIKVYPLWNLLYPQLELLRNIGGLTVSGGEPLLQSQLLSDLLFLCKKENFHTAIETSGALARRHITDVVEYVDCWLYGLRPTPAYKPNKADLITSNLAYLSGTGRRIIIRMPVIKGITDVPVSLNKITKTMQANGLHEIQLLPFNKGTSHYYHALGRECSIGDEAITSTENLNTVRNYFQGKNFSVSIIQ